MISAIYATDYTSLVSIKYEDHPQHTKVSRHSTLSVNLKRATI
jgi:hypothetical protein